MKNIDENYSKNRGGKKGFFCQKSEVTFSYFMKKNCIVFKLTSYTLDILHKYETAPFPEHIKLGIKELHTGKISTICCSTSLWDFFILLQELMLCGLICNRNRFRAVLLNQL